MTGRIAQIPRGKVLSMPASPAVRARRTSRTGRPAVWALAGALVLVAIGCSSDTPTGPGVVPGSAPPGGGAAGTALTGTPTGSAYRDTDVIAETLSGRDMPCALERTGIGTGRCRISGETAELRVWPEDGSLQRFLTSDQARSGVVAAGANWTVTVTTPDLARRPAGMLGGQVATPPPTTTTAAATTTVAPTTIAPAEPPVTEAPVTEAPIAEAPVTGPDGAPTLPT